MKKLFIPLAAAALIAAAVSCSKDGFLSGTDEYYASDKADAVPEGLAPSGDDSGSSTGEEPSGGDNSSAGVITAAEWNDLSNWSFWGGLMTGSYSSMNTLWGLSTAKRIAVSVKTPEGAPAAAIPVKLQNGGKTIWEAVTDNKGAANLWIAVEDVQSTVKAEECSISIAGEVQPEAPKVWAWNATEPVINEYTAAQGELSPIVDIAFIVDATGSMFDEIAFLKKDLQDIITRAGEIDTPRRIFTGTVFYRDIGDDYLTVKSDFTEDLKSTVAFIGKQNAEGGGDIPEAVHTALETAFTQLQWHNEAYAKMAFLVLDAQAHKDQKGVIESLQMSIRRFAAKGIRIIPVFCSSSEKECEFMCRQFAILTGGTYVFLTSDSGIGSEHVEASVGDYQIEHLNNLIVRLIKEYID